MNKDTARVIITQDCNLSCVYCCNNIPEVFTKFKLLPINDYQEELDKYDNICISGGEPLLYIQKTYNLLSKIKSNKKVYLYTNGFYLNNKLVSDLINKGVDGINIGIHSIENIQPFIEDFIEWRQIRFHVEDIYKDSISKEFIDRFVFWHRNSCKMNNEDWYILKE